MNEEEREQRTPVETPGTLGERSQDVKPPRRKRRILTYVLGALAGMSPGGYGAMQGADSADEDVVRELMKERVEFEGQLASVADDLAADNAALRAEVAELRREMNEKSRQFTEISVQLAMDVGGLRHLRAGGSEGASRSPRMNARERAMQEKLDDLAEPAEVKMAVPKAKAGDVHRKIEQMKSRRKSKALMQDL